MARVLAGFEREVSAFEQTVFDQRPVGPGHYDGEYFASDWREHGNRYDLETRREIEARNPELIKQVFEPRRVLDIGCGPGFLMFFLHELGIDVDGIDFSPTSLELAPETVREPDHDRLGHRGGTCHRRRTTSRSAARCSSI